ncbi:hypothetical protein DSCA_08370 [Desulfosarcina alkanivorans]|uniref:AAA+ ATPase domain-containing protein n=1 Tax=Desulfosarcina alkanivorans TaxID=571177 RepID=A0A5K7YQM0_9BACT|nr:AAA family ATPase [Desulfosarcina alkanivorans]BBO66907.1 hypothetical protein DSCA_08370 [Desulfosarcina alkanivorans]
MKIDLKKMDEFLETHIRPLWNDKGMDYPYRVGGGEVYLHDEVLAKAQPLMVLERIKKYPKDSLHGALKAHDNLLSQFEWSRAKDFILNTPEQELSENVLRLFDDSTDFQERLDHFLEWSMVSPSPDSENKMGINPTVCSFFLAMHDPVQYAFCKPMTYQALAKLLLVDEDPLNEPVQRIVQCTAFYKTVLRELEERYGLKNGNLLDVHSLAYTLKDLQSNAVSSPDASTKEKQLIEQIRQTDDYKDFKKVQLEPKIDRERRAWELLEKYRGAYTQEALNEIFDTVDLNPNNVRWFGSLLAHPNRNLIFGTPTDDLNGWIEKLLFSELPVEKALDDCLGKGKFKGAGNGLATLLLYLKNPDENVVWVPATEKGLAYLGRIKPGKAVSVGKKYLSFRKEAIDFRKQHQIEDRELDWYLSYISKHFGDANTQDDTGTIRYWTYAPGRDATFWESHYSNGIMTIGWDFLGDLTNIDDKETIRSKMQAEYGDKSSHMNSVLACYDFGNTIKPGDFVFAKKGKSQLLGYGIVQSDYYFDEHRPEHKHVRKVKWIKKGVWDTSGNQMALKTLTDITNYPDFVDYLKGVIGPVDRNSGSDRYDKENELQSIFLSDKNFDRILSLLEYKKNVILQGPPGVGKTFIARHLAWAMLGAKDESRTGMVQFHQSYAYEDFIQGFRPDENGNFILKNGVFFDFCRKAGRDRDNPYFFVIDEINRGNLSKIFGELMMLIEADKRDGYALPLTYAQDSGETFTVPSNVHLIGTMNTADRSLAMVDYALRRRFCFVDLQPAFNSDKFNTFLKDRIGIPPALIARINARIGALNTIISDETKNLGPGFCIGHSYFCSENGTGDLDDNWYRRIIEYEIAPLLKEYWFDNPSNADKQIDLLLE